MTREELQQNDGRNGRPAYIAVNRTVYDVSDSPLWKDGLHAPDHQAGRDLTEELLQAPHVRAVVERFPVVGQLAVEEQAGSGSGSGRPLVIAAVVAAVVVLLILVWVL